MKRFPHSVRLGLCFPVMFGAVLGALITNCVLIFYLGFSWISVDFLFDQFFWSFFFFHTGFCIVGIILTAGDALLTRPDFEVEERYEKKLKPYMRAFSIGVTGIQWIVRLILLACSIAHVVILVNLIIIWTSFFRA